MPPTIADIETRLRTAFAPVSLNIIDESASHAGHAGATAELSHITIAIVSDTFAGLSRIERHRAIHAVLAEDMLAIHSIRLISTLTAEEAAKRPL